MPPTHKIAVIQLYPKPLSPAFNFEKAAAHVRAAAQQGAHLAVLPEYHLTNWLPKDPRFARLCALTWREYLRKYQDLARETGICIVPGTIVRTREDAEIPSPPPSSPPPANTPPADTPTQDSTPAPEEAHAPPASTGGAAPYSASPPLQNTAYFISHTGAVLGCYTKKNLWGPTERGHLRSSGREPHDVIDTPLGPVGLLVCWDLAFPEAFRELVARGARLVVLPTFWTLSDCSDAGLRHNPAAEAVFVDSAVTARACENTCAVVMANVGGPPGRGYLGLSQVAVPFVGPLTRLGSCAEGMGVVEVDMQILDDAEENYQVRADLARDDWHYDYRHEIKDPEKKSRL